MDGTMPRAPLTSAAPRLAPAELAALRAYVPPQPGDPAILEASRNRVALDRRLAVHWLRSLGLSAITLYAIAVYVPASSASLVPILGLAAVAAALVCAPARGADAESTARMSADARFAPLLPAEAGVLLSFLYRHPEAAEVMATWLRHIPHLRRHDFEQFEAIFRRSAATASADEVHALLDQFDLVIPAAAPVPASPLA